MKKIILMIISILFIMTTAYANEECSLNLSVDVDNPCKVLVNIENAEHIYGGSFVLEYDNNIIELTECKVGSPIENTTAIINKSYADNKIKLTWASASAITYNEPILNVEFKVIDDDVTQSEITFDEVTLYDINSNEVMHEINNVILSLPNSNKTPPSTSEENIISRPAGGISKYTIEFETNGGSIIADKTVTRKSKLAEPETPEKNGYSFDGWYTDKELTKSYDFSTKVTKSFTLYAKWTEIEKEPVVDVPDTTITFTDVNENDWFYANVQYVVENNLMNGIAVDEFAPNNTLTRAMLVTVLYRNAGEPAVNKSIPFADVDMSSWYVNAVIWAKQNAIVNGVNETDFAPNSNITREQIAAIMHRYAKYKGYDASVGENTNILSYDDVDSISEYAIASMQYVVGSGLIKGKSNTTLNPLDNATRAEIAAILNRFIEANQ